MIVLDENLPDSQRRLRFAEVQVKSIMHQMLLGLRLRVSEGYRMPVQQAPISKRLDGLPISLERLA